MPRLSRPDARHRIDTAEGAMTSVSSAARTELRLRASGHVGDHAVDVVLVDGDRTVVVATGDGRVVGLSTEQGDVRFDALAHEGGIVALAASADGMRFATTGFDGTACVHAADGRSTTRLGALRSPTIERLAFAKSASLVAFATGRYVRVADVDDDGATVAEFGPLAGTVTGLEFLGDGTDLVASSSAHLHLLSFADGTSVRSIEARGTLVSLSVRPGGRVVACGARDSSVRFFRLPEATPSAMTGYRFPPTVHAWSADGALLATSGDATVTVWDFDGAGPEGTRPFRLSAHRGLCTTLAFAPHSGWLASGSEDTSILIWDPRRGEKPLRFAFLEDVVTSLRWQACGRRLVASDASGNVALLAID